MSETREAPCGRYDDHNWSYTGSPTYCRDCHIIFPAWNHAQRFVAVAVETCWFCKRTVPVDALIAGYDTFDEQRLACLACNERMSGNWRPNPVPSVGVS